ncbi:MAG TPA: methyltransferase [Gaiellaceae bacterium]|nr:methyltransferase [Gaiellaceae bacterium]
MPALDEGPIRALGARLRELRFGPAAIHEAFGLENGLMRVRGDKAVQLRRLAPGEPLSTVITLFLLGEPVTAEAAAAAFFPVALEAVEGLGLAARNGGEVRALVQLFPFEGLVLASDRYDALEEPGASADYVGNVNPTSITLGRLTTRRPVETALDVGCGCGVQALLAARHAKSVLAVDLNPRAVEFTRFNALLNEVDNVECGVGSFFEPAEGRRFDLVLANPPFVVSPDARFTFRDGGLAGDAVCELIVGEAPDYLEEGGFAHVLCSWASRTGEDWRAAPTRWIEGRGCDAWVLHHRSEDPLAYAAAWNQLVRSSSPDAYPAALDRWLDYYAELGIESLEYGAVTLRRRDAGPNWLRLDELPEPMTTQAGDHVLRAFATQDYLLGLPEPEAALADAFTLADDQRLDQTMRLAGGEFVVERTLLRLDRGLPFEGAVDGYGLHVLTGCDGTRPLGELLDEVAAGAGLDRDTFVASSLVVVRRLLELGFLVPPDGRRAAQGGPPVERSEDG